MSPLTDLSARPRLRRRFADACFDEACLLLTLDGQPVELERRPLLLLALLALLEEIRRRLGPRHPLTLQVESELAVRLGNGQHAGQAMPLARETVALTQQVYGADHILTQERRFNLAQVLVEATHIDEAVPILIDVRRRLLAITGTETDLSANVADALAMAHLFVGKHAESLPLLQIVLDYSMRTRGETSDMARDAMSNMARAMRYLA